MPEFDKNFLRSLLPSKLPPAALRLRISSPIILIRNLNKIDGLYNSTRLVVTSLEKYGIKARNLISSKRTEY